MEEKLYFKPASYGKGIKQKEKPAKKKEKEDGDKTHRVRNLVLFLFLIVIVVIIILWLLHGKTTTTGQYPANVKNESLECVSTSLTYPKLGSFSPVPAETNLTITAVFSGEDALRTISVKNLMTFASNSEAIVAEARTHANFNIGLRTYNYGTEKFDNKFSIMHDKLLVNLTVKAKELDEFSKGYFLITSEALPATLADFQREYEAQGFICRTEFNETNSQQE